MLLDLFNWFINVVALQYRNLLTSISSVLRWPFIVFSFFYILYKFLHNPRINPKRIEHFFHKVHSGGHRGSPLKGPENTISAMEQAKADGAEAVEFDVSLTKDGIAVLLHDHTLDRTTDMSGHVRDYTYAELKAANCGVKLGWKKPLPTLEDMVIWAEKNKVKMFLDIKETDSVMLKILLDLFERHKIYKSGIVCSFYPLILYRLKRKNPNILTGLTWCRWVYSYEDLKGKNPVYSSRILQFFAEILDQLNEWSVKTWLPSFLGVDLVLTERAEISERFVRQQEEAKRRVCAWTINDPYEMNWMKKVLKIPFLTDNTHLVKETLHNIKSVQG